MTDPKTTHELGDFILKFMGWYVVLLCAGFLVSLFLRARKGPFV